MSFRQQYIVLLSILICVWSGLVSASVPLHTGGLLLNSVLKTKSDLVVCWQDPEPENPLHRAGKQWVEESVKGTWEKVAAVRFTYWGACDWPGPTADVQVKIDDDRERRVGVRRENGIIKVNLNFDFNGVLDERFNCADKVRHCAEAQAVHEFGHVLGFRHTADRADILPTVPAGACNDPQGAGVNAQPISDWDLYSVMNQCGPRYGMHGEVGDTALTAADIFGAIRTYGPNSLRALDENEEGDRFGHALARADFNGDTIQDLAVSAPGENAVYIFIGTARGGLRPSMRLRGSDIGVFASDAEFGTALAAGDFNGDGVDDLAVGLCEMRSANQTSAKMVSVYKGSAAGLSQWRIIENSESEDVCNEFHTRLSLSAGDITGDVFEELIVGAYGIPRGGRVFVYRGSRFGPSVQVTLDPRELNDEVLGGSFGAAISVGDFDGDGTGELAIGAPSHTDPKGESGAVVILDVTENRYQMTQELTLDDIDAEEFRERTQMGASLASGDLNNDGIDDLVVGVPYGFSEDGVESGIAVVYRGSANTLTATQVLSQSGLERNNSEDQFGSALSIDDLNADGYEDLVVGAPGKTVVAGPLGEITDREAAGLAFAFISRKDQLYPWQVLDQTAIGNPEAQDKMSSALVIGKFDQLGERPQIVISAPNEAPYDDPRSGYLFVYTSPDVSEVTDHFADPLEKNIPAKVKEQEIEDNPFGVPGDVNIRTDPILLWYGFGQGNY